MCEEGRRQSSFLCPRGTIFNQVSNLEPYQRTLCLALQHCCFNSTLLFNTPNLCIFVFKIVRPSFTISIFFISTRHVESSTLIMVLCVLDVAYFNFISIISACFRHLAKYCLSCHHFSLFHTFILNISLNSL